MMYYDCKFFESVTKRWAYCNEKDEFSLKDDEDFCNKCPHNKKEVVINK